MSARGCFLSVARHPFIHYAVEVALHRHDFSLMRRIKCSLRIGVQPLIVKPSLLRVAQDVVGFVDLCEALIGVGRGGNVRVALSREAAVSRFDFRLSRAACES